MVLFPDIEGLQKFPRSYFLLCILSIFDEKNYLNPGASCQSGEGA